MRYFLTILLVTLYPTFAYAYIDVGSVSIILQGAIGGLMGFLVFMSVMGQRVKNFFRKMLGLKIVETKATDKTVEPPKQ